MSIHKSLKSKGKLVRMRNVLNRWERIEVLIKESKWGEEKDSPYGLRKVRVLKIKKRGKEPKKKDDEEGDGTSAESADSVKGS